MCVLYAYALIAVRIIFLQNRLPPITEKVVFIDFGCGPLTSGIAFWAFARQNEHHFYLGIDSSQTMLDKAREINQYACQQISNPYFKTFETARDYNEP